MWLDECFALGVSARSCLCIAVAVRMGGRH